LAGTLPPEKKGPVKKHIRPDDCTFLFFPVVIWRLLRFGGNGTTGKKKRSVVWPAVFWRVPFVLDLVQINLIHFEHTKCIS
jgi:hypothetical protein